MSVLEPDAGDLFAGDYDIDLGGDIVDDGSGANSAQEHIDMGGITVGGVGSLQIEGIVGFSGKVANGLLLHPDDTHMIHALGSTIVIKNVEQTDDQILLCGHTDRITCMALTPDGSMLASGQVTHMGLAAEIILWDLSCLASGGQPMLIIRLKLHKGYVRSLAFSRSGRYLASVGGADDNNLVVWNIATGQAICGSPAAHDECLSVKWLHGSDEELITCGMRNLRAWKLVLETRKLQPSEIASYGKDQRTYTCLAISPDDSTVYCGTSTGDIVIVDYKTKKAVAVGPDKGSTPQCGIRVMAYIASRHELIVGSGAGELMAIDAHTLQPTCTQMVMGAVSSLAFDTANDFFFTGTEDSNMYLVQCAGLVSELKSSAHHDPITDAVFPRGYSEVFATCAGSQIRVWHTTTLSEVLRVQVPNQVCNCIAFMPKGDAIVSGWNDGRVRAFLPQSGGLQYVINDAHKLVGVGNASGGIVQVNGVTSVQPTNDGTRLLSGGADGQLRVWAISRGTQVMIASMKEHKGPITAISVTNDDSQCVTASADGSILTWSLHDDCPFMRINALFASTFFTAVAYHPDESQLLTCGTDRNIAWWDANTMGEIRILPGSETAQLNSLHVNGDGRFFVAGGADRYVTLWNYDEGSKYYEGLGHSGSVSKVKISPDEQRIISVGSEGGIFVWKMPAGL